MWHFLGQKWRWLIGAMLWAAAGYILSSSFHAGSGLEVFGRAVFGMAFLIAGAIAVSTQVVEWLASPFVAFVNGIYLGTETADKPPFTMDLGLHYEKFQQPELAQEHYERMIHFYPRRIEPYAGLIRVLRNDLDDTEVADSVRRAALHYFSPGELEPLIRSTATELIDASRTILIR